MSLRHLFSIACLCLLFGCASSPSKRKSKSKSLTKELAQLVNKFEKSKSKKAKLNATEKIALSELKQLANCLEQENTCFEEGDNDNDEKPTEEDTPEISALSKVTPPSKASQSGILTLDELEVLDLKSLKFSPPTSEQLDKRLSKINDYAVIPLVNNVHVQEQINFYLTKRAYLLPKIVARSERYFPMIEEILSQYNLPLELKYLAIVESALVPRAGSRVGAKGLWQFMYWTGKLEGLEINSLIDQRYDPVKSTHAAAQYLTKLYKKFKDWHLALAAYNSGPGNVAKAIRRSGGIKNYWSIRPYLPRETNGYVPAFIAVNYWMKHLKEHQIPKDKIGLTYFDLDTISFHKKATFKDITTHLDISEKELVTYNPQLIGGIVPGHLSKKGHWLHLPKDKADFLDETKDSFYRHLDSLNKTRKIIPKSNLSGRVYYRVRRGDALSTIARKFGVSVRKIKRWNGLRSSRIRVGQRLKIFPRKNRHLASSRKKSSKRRKSVSYAPIGKYEWYKIKSGETFWEIAQRFKGISANQLMYWNNIRRSKDLKPGMNIKVPKV